MSVAEERVREKGREVASTTEDSKWVSVAEERDRGREIEKEGEREVASTTEKNKGGEHGCRERKAIT